MSAKLFFAFLIALAVFSGVCFVWRYLDIRKDQAEMGRLLALQPVEPDTFSAEMIADLPMPAQRYFTFMIAEGTPLLTVAQIEMTGQFSLGSQDAPNYMTMRAKQVLAPPEGFIWEASMRSGHLRFSGSDTGRWTRFWGWEFLPVARAGGDADHARSAFGRFMAEAVFWTPAALLPSDDVTWTAPENDIARVTVRKGSWEQAVDIRLDEDGRPLDVSLMRWSNANADRVYRAQPFGGAVSDFRSVQGFQVPMRVEAGNFFGSDAYFPFFIAEVTDISYPSPLTDR